MCEEICKIKQLMEKFFGVNLILMVENDIWMLVIFLVIKEEGVKVVVYIGYGDGLLKLVLFDELKVVGIIIIYCDINLMLENSCCVEQVGVDIIVVIGFDEGGMLLGIVFGIFIIVLLIVDVVQWVLVMVVGGIIDVWGVCVVYVLGVEGVFVGLVFISIIESWVFDLVKVKIVVVNGLDLCLFCILLDYYCVLFGKLSDILVVMDCVGVLKVELVQVMGGLCGMWLGMLEGNIDEGYILVGVGIGNIYVIIFVVEVVNQLVV